jgi:hypothetical protein
MFDSIVSTKSVFFYFNLGVGAATQQPPLCAICEEMFITHAKLLDRWGNPGKLYVVVCDEYRLRIYFV